MTIQFDKSIYSETAVKQAIEDYTSIAEINMISTPESYICSINQSDYPMETTALEFSNYVLNLTVMCEKEA